MSFRKKFLPRAISELHYMEIDEERKNIDTHANQNISD